MFSCLESGTGKVFATLPRGKLEGRTEEGHLDFDAAYPFKNTCRKPCFESSHWSMPAHEQDVQAHRRVRSLFEKLCRRYRHG